MDDEDEFWFVLKMPPTPTFTDDGGSSLDILLALSCRSMQANKRFFRSRRFITALDE